MALRRAPSFEALTAPAQPQGREVGTTDESEQSFFDFRDAYFMPLSRSVRVKGYTKCLRNGKGLIFLDNLQVYERDSVA
jgi:hypothetical protein